MSEACIKVRTIVLCSVSENTSVTSVVFLHMRLSTPLNTYLFVYDDDLPLRSSQQGIERPWRRPVSVYNRFPLGVMMPT